MEYSVYEILFLFIVYSFFGWCLEVVYHAVIKGGFINRGFDIGPICPIYGFGAISVILFLEPFEEHCVLLFFASVAFTTLIEFVGGFLLEKLFNEKWWDYSNEPYNIKGYICPRFSLLWGIACVVVVYVIHPAIITPIRLIPIKLGMLLLAIFYLTFAADLIVTMINVMHIRSSLKAIKEIEHSLESLSVSIGTNLTDSTLAVVDKTEKLKEELDEKHDEMAEAISDAQWELNDAKIKLQSKKQLADEKHRAEYEEFTEKLKAHQKNISTRSRRISAAFPNINELIFSKLDK